MDKIDKIFIMVLMIFIVVTMLGVLFDTTTRNDVKALEKRVTTIEIDLEVEWTK